MNLSNRRQFLQDSLQLAAAGALGSSTLLAQGAAGGAPHSPFRSSPSLLAAFRRCGTGLAVTEDGWALNYRGHPVIQHSPTTPCCYAGRGTETVDRSRGSFALDDFVEERQPLRFSRLEERSGALHVALAPASQTPPVLNLVIRPHGAGVEIEFEQASPGLNRLWWRVAAQPDDHVWGCGEQFTYFDLRGRHFPLWVSEQGVGRDKSTYLTWQADQAGKNGGDYYTTYFPQPTFLSSVRYCLHVDTSAYADFDFRHPGFHELQCWGIPKKIELFFGASFVELLGRMGDRFGRRKPLPAWVATGAILGLKEGREHAEHILKLSQDHGLKVSALWCEDWAGIRPTAFGKRVFWDWKWNGKQYPEGKAWTDSLRQRQVRFLGYVNPYLCSDGTLYREAAEAGYLVRNREQSAYLLDFGEFKGGMVDFTNPAAARWFSERIIGREMIEAGLDGWMADFGEYLPTDAVLASGESAMTVHNRWPTLWSKVNADAIERAGRGRDATFFMRSGYTGSAAHCPMLWAGDQNVDFTRGDGLPSVVCAALSSGLLGNSYHHSDIGGYTSLFGNRRTPELFQRWAEMAAFTPLMRTHEGNRPDDNFQFWQDDAVLAHFAKMTRIFVALAPYTRRLAAQAAELGLPLQRPLFLHHEHDPAAYAIQDAYLYGEDILVAPVHESGRAAWETYLPGEGQWIHLWTRQSFPGGQRATVASPLGQPPIFIRAECANLAQLLALAQA